MGSPRARLKRDGRRIRHGVLRKRNRELHLQRADSSRLVRVGDSGRDQSVLYNYPVIISVTRTVRLKVKSEAYGWLDAAAIEEDAPALEGEPRIQAKPRLGAFQSGECEAPRRWASLLRQAVSRV